MASSTPTSVEGWSQAFQTEFEDICGEIQGSVLPNIIMPWTDDDGAATDSCVLGPSVDGGMPERLVALLKNNLMDLSAFDEGDFQDWNVVRPQPQWPTSTSDWEKWLPRMKHFFGQQWKDQGIYHSIKLFDRLLVMDRSLLAAALCFWSSATNTMNFRFGMMTPTVLDMAALFGLSPLGVEVNAALVAPEAEGSFKAAWPTLMRLAGSKAKNMLNYSSLCSNFGVEDSVEDDAIAPLGEVEHAAFLLYWCATHDLSVIPDGETENDLKEIWGSFLVTRDLHCGLSKAGAEVCLPNFVAWQFGLIQTAPLPPLSTNRLSSWRADVTQQHGVAGISFQLQKGMTFLTHTP
ncbi:uncharacterized protein Pyn_06103 [Prunus yedoensis var. nudiflora]|uniref:Aminotransferase-like plant mobile domain-containing protein n=1 Tax=Prunus yedoensis var. nudiflora TaxID=2094558 RepID=A0A314UU27_PRUYE|nr:uncharacterized protein Pyn_06103 [Prunus yedoensis var. nudiflora]